MASSKLSTAALSADIAALSALERTQGPRPSVVRPQVHEASTSAKEATEKAITLPNAHMTTTAKASNIKATHNSMAPTATQCEKNTRPDISDVHIVTHQESGSRNLPTGGSSNEEKSPLSTSFHVDIDPRKPLGMFVITHKQAKMCIVRSIEPFCVQHPDLRPGVTIETASIIGEFFISDSIKVESHRDLKLIYIRASQSNKLAKLRLRLKNDKKDLEYTANESELDGGWDGRIKQTFKQEPTTNQMQTTAQPSKEMSNVESQESRKRVRFVETLNKSNKRQRLEKFVCEETFSTVKQDASRRHTPTAAPDIVSFLKAVASETNEWKSQREVESTFMELQLDKRDRNPLRIVRDRVTQEGLVEWGRVFLSIGAIVKKRKPQSGYSEKCYMKLSRRGVAVLSVAKVKTETLAFREYSI